MKNNKYTIALLSLLMLYPNTIYAACTNDELNHFKEIAKDYKITYEFNKETKKYAVSFYSPEPNRYEYTIHAEGENFSGCEYPSDLEMNCSSVTPNEYLVEIIGQTKECDAVLKTIDLLLPNYNKYSEDPICLGIEDFVLCQPTYDKEIDYDTFVSRVNTYKKTLSKTEIKDDNNQVNDNKILTYIKNNLFEIITISAFTIMVIITIVLTIITSKKRRRLE